MRIRHPQGRKLLREHSRQLNQKRRSKTLQKSRAAKQLAHIRAMDRDFLAIQDNFTGFRREDVYDSGRGYEEWDWYEDLDENLPDN